MLKETGTLHATTPRAVMTNRRPVFTVIHCWFSNKQKAHLRQTTYVEHRLRQDRMRYWFELYSRTTEEREKPRLLRERHMIVSL